MIINSQENTKARVTESQVPGPAEQSEAVRGTFLLGEQAAPLCTCLRGYESGRFDGSLLEREKRARKFYVRCRDGIWIAQRLGYPVRWFSLTESDYAIGMGLSFGVCVHNLERKLRRDYGRNIGFLWVEHLQGDKQRYNRHFIEWGKAKLNPRELDDYWHKQYGSKVTGLAMVKDAEKAAHYLARYVAGEGYVRARFSYNWVFRDCFDFGRWVKRQQGEYPDIETLAKLSVMSPVERLSVVSWRAYAVSKQGAVKQKLADKVLGVGELDQMWLAGCKRKARSRVSKISMLSETREALRRALGR